MSEMKIYIIYLPRVLIIYIRIDNFIFARNTKLSTLLQSIFSFSTHGNIINKTIIYLSHMFFSQIIISKYLLGLSLF